MKCQLSSIFIASVVAIFLSGCGNENAFVPPPPPEVGVQKPVIGTETVYSEFAGRTSGSARVEIRARVKGFLKEIAFTAGQYVEEGDLLFTIEPEQFEAAVTTAEGKLAKAKADLEIATTNWKKRKQAFDATGAVSEIDVLSAEAEKKAAEAGVAIAEAELANAKRDLGYTKIHAPMSGRVSNAQVDQGNLVGASDPTLLTDIISVQPVHFNFEVSERDILPHLADMPNAENPLGSEDKEGIKQKELDLVLADGEIFEEKGRFDYGDNSVNPDSGTMKARAAFTNKNGKIVDGLFARIRIPKKLDSAVQVPADSIQRDLGGSFVLVVNEKNVVERRPVVPTQHSVGTMKIIAPFDEETGSGLKPDDRIVVSNIQRAREGIQVRPADADSVGKEAQQPPGEQAEKAPAAKGEKKKEGTAKKQ